MDVKYEIERMLQFGQKHGMIKALDVLVSRNALLDIFGLDSAYEGAVPEEDFDRPTELLENLLDCAAEMNLFDNSVYQYRVNFEARIMGTMMPRESECAKKFKKLCKKKGPKAATDWFYKLCIDSNYIRTAQIAQNIQWNAPTPYGDLEITINLTKPEKDPKTIALERSMPQAGYPKCMLCKENIGYAGRVNFPARQTHRIIPLELSGERFFLQYSPYVYFNEHCIVFNEQHKPMTMDHATLEQIFSFVEQFPHYTCGSNADLPIVGGSILSHAHYQGGCYVFPMTKANIQTPLKAKSFKHVSAGILNWPMACIRLISESKEELLAAADVIMETWQSWDDPVVDIRSHTGDTRHNTITPILHKDQDDRFVLDIVPRNNRTSEQYPDGIFHPHAEYHNIKKENIGLIEVMGLAILPSRLKEQSLAIADILSGKAANTSRQEGSSLAVHANWIDELVAKYGTAVPESEALEIVRKEIGIVFSHVLENAGVFKQDAQGHAAFLKFAYACGFEC